MKGIGLSRDNSHFESNINNVGSMHICRTQKRTRVYCPAGFPVNILTVYAMSVNRSIVRRTGLKKGPILHAPLTGDKIVMVYETSKKWRNGIRHWLQSR